MKLKDIVDIVLEERAKHDDPVRAVPYIQTRIATSIAERLIQPALTPEKWALFLGLIEFSINQKGQYKTGRKPDDENNIKSNHEYGHVSSPYI